MLKRIFLATACFAWLAALPAVASEPATLVLKSGERVQAELLDHGGVGFTVRVNGAERRIPTDDVAVIEFTGSDPNNNDIRNRMKSGQPFVVLRNGQIVEGRLYDIGGVRCGGYDRFCVGLGHGTR